MSFAQTVATSIAKGSPKIASELQKLPSAAHLKKLLRARTGLTAKISAKKQKSTPVDSSKNLAKAQRTQDLQRRYSLIDTSISSLPQTKGFVTDNVVRSSSKVKEKQYKVHPEPVYISPALISPTMIRVLTEPVITPSITPVQVSSDTVKDEPSTGTSSHSIQQSVPKEPVQDFSLLGKVLDELTKNPGALADSREVAQLVAQLSKELNVPNPMAPQRRATFSSASIALPQGVLSHLSLTALSTPSLFPKGVQSRGLHSMAFTDSGVGGLFFLYDALQKLLPVLLDAAKQYKLEDRPVEFVHLGDTANAPYGGKTREQITELTIGLIQASNQVSDAIVVACNTASSTRPMIWDSPAVRSIVSEKPVLTLIEDSAQALYEASKKQIVTGSDGEKTLYIGFLGTPALVDSGRYQDTLRAIHKKAIEDGQIPVGTKLEIVAYGPKEWVANIEAGKTDILNLKVAEDMAVLKGKAGAEHIKIWGSYCTHFPYVTEGILKVLDPDKSKGIAMLSQGAIFADKLATIFRAELAQDFEPRETVLTTEQAEKFLANYFQIRSLISGQNQDAVQFAASQFNPELALKTIFGGQYPTPPVSQ